MHDKNTAKSTDPIWDSRNSDEPCAKGNIPELKPPSCPVCGGAQVETRGRYPDHPRRIVCPTCMADRLDHIHEITGRDYDVAKEAKPPNAALCEVADKARPN